MHIILGGNRLPFLGSFRIMTPFWSWHSHVPSISPVISYWKQVGSVSGTCTLLKATCSIKNWHWKYLNPPYVAYWVDYTSCSKERDGEREKTTHILFCHLWRRQVLDCFRAAHSQSFTYHLISSSHFMITPYYPSNVLISPSRRITPLLAYSSEIIWSGMLDPPPLTYSTSGHFWTLTILLLLGKAVVDFESLGRSFSGT